MNWAILIVFLQGVFELGGLSAFLIGYFVKINWIMILGGILVVADDLIEISMGILKPLFPVVLAVGLAIIISPWYVGVFLSSAVFKVFGIPQSVKKIFNPKKVIEIARSHKEFT